jgi:hypothetical protein
VYEDNKEGKHIEIHKKKEIFILYLCKPPPPKKKTKTKTKTKQQQQKTQTLLARLICIHTVD